MHQTTNPAVPRLRRKPLLLATIVIAILMLGVLHRRILVAMAAMLVCDQSEREFDYICLMPDFGAFVKGEDTYPTVARLYHEVPSRRLLAIDPPPTRAVRVGAMPSFRATLEKQLARRGVPENVAEILPVDSNSELAKAKALAVWLARHPPSRVQVVCGRLESATLRRFLDQHLPPAEACRVSLRAQRNQEYDETNWWRTRSGIRTLMFEYLAVLYAWTGWKDDPPVFPPEPDAYERRFLGDLQEAKGR